MPEGVERLIIISRHERGTPWASASISSSSMRLKSWYSSVIEDARRILAATGAELGGVEYLVNARDRQPYFYDVNVLSNFVADAPSVIGFDPFVNLVDFIADRAQERFAAYGTLAFTD